MTFQLKHIHRVIVPEIIIKAALMSAPIGLVISDERGVVQFANRTFHRITGWSEQVLKGKPVSAIFTGPVIDLEDQSLSFPWQQEVQCLSPAGTVMWG